MDILADTNILIRRINRFDAQHKEARAALRVLEERGDRVCLVPQRRLQYSMNENSASPRPPADIGVRRAFGNKPLAASRKCALS